MDANILDIIKDEINPQTNNKINHFYALIYQNEITMDEWNSIKNSMHNYLLIYNYKNHSPEIVPSLNNQIEWYLNLISLFINECQNEPITPIKRAILSLLEDPSLKDDNSESKSIARTRLKNGIAYYEPAMENNEDLYRGNGFVSTVLITASVIILGITLAILIH